MRAAATISAVVVGLFGALAPVRAADDAAVREEIRAAEERFSRADIRRDVTGILQIYADDVVFFPPGEPPLSGRSAVSRWMSRSRGFGRIVREQFEIASLDVCLD